MSLCSSHFKKSIQTLKSHGNPQDSRLLNYEVFSNIFRFGRILVWHEKMHWGRGVKSQEEGIENIPKSLLSTKGIPLLRSCSLSSTAGHPAAAQVLSISWGSLFSGRVLLPIWGKNFLQWSCCGGRHQSFRILGTVLSKPVPQVFLYGRSRAGNSRTKEPLRRISILFMLFHCYQLEIPWVAKNVFCFISLYFGDG